VAIVQVSRITNRKGLTENLPQLAGAEFGWCTDSRRLFIGNGTLEDGAPSIGNTEILTEYSDFIQLGNYTYADVAVGYAAQTGPTSNDPVVRTVQAKLDDFADIRDFGGVGDGVADDTAAINRALFQLYCREPDSQVRRTLYFPAGTYRVSGTIIIPTYAKLVGEGAECSIILLDPDDSTAPNYLAQYGDSLQQTGVNIGNNGAVAPRNIEISSMTFQSAVYSDIFQVSSAAQCYFDSVNFIGPLTQSETVNASADLTGVEFDSTPVLICNQITFDKCRFSGLTYGINTLEQIQSVTVSNSKFDTLYQGIVLGDGTPVLGGATGFRAIHNMFDAIYAEGIIYDEVSLNVTAYNVFYDVGNQYTGNPSVPVIVFGNDNNVSLSDMFERTDVEAQIQPRVVITGGATTTSTQIQLGRYARESGRTATLTNNVSNQVLFTINSADIAAFRMDYTVVRAATVKNGALTVVDGPSYVDDYCDNLDTGVTFSATQSGDTISVRYTTTNTGTNATLTYSLAHLA